MSDPERLWAVRGAVQVDRNEAGAILAATEELVRELMTRNGLVPDSLVSCIFTVTPDLDAEFPAVAARRLGLDAIPLLCANEVAVPGAMPRVIRALVHYHADRGHRPAHAYLGDAQALRSDLQSAQ
jgi:chorismate mutase